MGLSTNGQICFGIIPEEDTELPWGNEEYNGDMVDWWIYGVGEFKHSLEIFTPDGKWIDGKRAPQEQIDAYFAEKLKHLEYNPLPSIELVNYCSCEEPMWIIAVPSSVMDVHRGYPKEFDPQSLQVTDEEVAALKSFCVTYGIPMDGEPKWILSSLMC